MLQMHGLLDNVQSIERSIDSTLKIRDYKQYLESIGR